MSVLRDGAASTLSALSHDRFRSNEFIKPYLNLRMTEFIVGATHTSHLLIESTVFASKMNEEESEIVMSLSNTVGSKIIRALEISRVKNSY